MKRALLYVFAAALSLAGQAQTAQPNEQWVQSLHGSTSDMPLAPGQRLRVHDPEFNYQLANPTTFTQRYEQRRSEAVVQLRFDESKRVYYDLPWTCSVNYVFTTYNIDGTVSPPEQASLLITYDPAAPYTDIAANYVSNVIWASLRVQQVTCTLSIDNTPIPPPEDVYLDLRLDVDRHYDLGPSEAPQFTAWPAYPVQSDPSHLMLRWNFVEGADSYDLEWVFVDCISISGPNVTTCSPNNLAYDFSNATRVNVTGNEYEIPLAYPRGWLVFRARAVGRETAFGAREEGPWNLAQATPNVGTAGDFHRFQVTGLDNARNWTYEAGYAEQGLRKEVLSFFDGSLRPRQSMTLLNTDKIGLLDNKVFDALGRPALSLLPYPINDRVLSFKPNQLLMGGTHYGWSNFDLGTNVQQPDPLPGTVPAGEYYSSMNDGSLGFMGNLTPDAKDFPFTRTTFWNDGTGRVREEAGPGPEHTMGSGHTTRYAYGTPGSQYELDRLFGNEAGYVRHYKKNTVTDPNGVTSVTYQDSHGRTIATALAGFPAANDPLLPVDTYTEIGVNQVVTAPVTSVQGPNGEWMVNNTFALSTATDLTLTYQLDPADYFECIERPCVYDLSIKLLDDCGNEMSLGANYSSGYTCNDCEGVASISFTVALQAGTYTLVKVLELDPTKLDLAMQAFINEPCIPRPLAPPTECDDCESLCQGAYTTDVDGVAYYTDDNGIPTSAVDPGHADYVQANATAALQAIADCEALCGDPPMPSRCSIMHHLLAQDMSPGGQYFSNAPHETATPYDPNAWDDWLVPNIGQTPTGIVAGQTTWTGVRDNWQESWVDLLIPFHPEYCQFQFYCESECIEYVGGVPQPPVQIPFYGPYYNVMYGPDIQDQFDVTSPLFNPLNLPQYTAPGPYQGGAYYQPASTAGPHDELIICFKDCKSNILYNLTTFMERVPGQPGQGHYSIWEVIADPDGIAVANGGNNTGLPQSVIDFFNLLHGDGVNQGLIASQPPLGVSQFTPYQFFRGVYDFYRELIAYQAFTSPQPNDDCLPNFACNSLLVSPENTGLTADGYIIRYPRNPIFDNWEDIVSDPSFFAQGFGNDQQDALCEDACAGAAETQMALLQPCDGTITTGCYDDEDADCIREALIAVCQLGCSDDQPGGSSLGDGDMVTPNATACNQSFNTFQEVLNAYIIGTAPVAIEHPVEGPTEPAEAPTAQCACEGLQEFIAAQEPGTTAAEIMENLEELRGEDDLWVNSTSTLSNWQSLCSNVAANETQILAALFPSAFACPTFSEPESDCASDEQALAQYNLDQQWLAELQTAAQAYRSNLAAACMAEIATRETFTMRYTLSEYHYTLYYYDQAGNLVKTVPPAGVNLNLANSYYPDDADDVGDNLSFTGTDAIVDFSAAVAAHRATPADANTPYIRPWHSMVTWYTYNSFQQPVAQHYPDGGTTRFFYDKLGRIIASQDAVQEQSDHYSYTLYDDLGRPYEVGQLRSPSAALDAEIARGEGVAPVATWQDFLAQITAKDQITRTYYTTPLEQLDPDLTDVTGSFAAAGQQNLRNRVVGVTFLETPSSLNPPVDEYDQATHYSYDIHGNVKSLVQEIRELDELGQGFKRMDYSYDLISGKVLEVDYQHGQWDQWHHRYRYDADGRLLEARTSADGRIWERDARYFYYAHGPLARTELGDKSVQGTDHYYTLHGWLRGVNSPTMDLLRDPGKDSGNSTNWFFAEDAASYALGYYPGDYIPVVGGTAFMLPDNGTGSYATALADRALYNGNIPTMLTGLRDQDGQALDLHANVYSYDRLNRLKEMNVYHAAASSTLQDHENTGTFRNNFVYDPNGNIGYQKRWGQNAEVVDDLKYNYYQIADQPFPAFAYTNPDPIQPPYTAPPFERTNRLIYAEGQLGAPTFQQDGNYEYDATGRLTKDAEAGIGANGIGWTLQDKIRRVTRAASEPAAPNLDFRYGPTGHRTVKEVRARANGNLLNENEWATTYYIHDAQGNPMAIYMRSYQALQGTNAFRDRLQVDGLPIYGSARLGMHARSVDYRADFMHAGFVDNHFGARSYTTMPTPWVEDASVTRALGEKRYELTNHQSNVLSTITDRRVQVPTSQAPTSLSHYAAEVRSFSDYYPFGLLMPGRHDPGDLDEYRFAFQGQEHDDEINGSTATSYAFEYRMHDPRIGRFLSIDPLFMKYPHWSPYVFSGNRIIDMIELEGLEPTEPLSFWTRLLNNATGRMYENRALDWASAVGIDRENIFYLPSAHRINGKTVIIPSDAESIVMYVPIIDPSSGEIIAEYKRTFHSDGSDSGYQPWNLYWDDEGNPIFSDESDYDSGFMLVGPPGGGQAAKGLRIAAAGSRSYVIYRFIDAVSNTPYFGRSLNYARRMAQHGSRILSGSRLKILESIPTKELAAGVEQLSIEYGRRIGKIANKINALNPKNKKRYDRLINEAVDYLKKNDPNGDLKYLYDAR